MVDAQPRQRLVERAQHGARATRRPCPRPGRVGSTPALVARTSRRGRHVARAGCRSAPRWRRRRSRPPCRQGAAGLDERAQLVLARRARRCRCPSRECRGRAARPAARSGRGTALQHAPTVVHQDAAIRVHRLPYPGRQVRSRGETGPEHRLRDRQRRRRAGRRWRQEAERLGYSVAWAAEAYGSDAATVLSWLAAQHRADRRRLRGHADPGADTRDDGDDRGHAGPARRAGASGSGSASPDRRSRRAGTGCGSTSRWHGPVSTSTSSGRRCARETVRHEGEYFTAAAARRAGQGAEAEPAPAARPHPDLPRRGRPEEPRADRRDR